jgi:putative FmdB family regulatory protein
MPTYDWECPNGHVFEEWVPSANFKEIECPTCKAQAKRLISAPPTNFRCADSKPNKSKGPARYV